MKHQRRAHLRAFTLIELLLAVAILALLIGLLVVGMSKAFKGASVKAGEQTVAAMKTAVEMFKSEFHFAPPLVKDLEIISAGADPAIPVYLQSNPTDLAVLRRDVNPTDPEIRFSTLSLPYYLAGLCSYTPSNWQVPIDGVIGPGMLEPLPDGRFKVPASLRSTTSTIKSTGKTYAPYMDTSRASLSVVQGDAATYKVEFRDRKNIPYRYYRWMPDPVAQPVNVASYNDHGIQGLRAYLNVPLVVGDPDTDPRLRNATYAIVWAGADGLFGDESQQVIETGLGATFATEAAARLAAMKDNAVEAGP